MIANVKLATVILNRNWCIVFVHDHFLELTGWKKEEILKKDWIEIFTIPEKKHRAQDIRRMLISGKVEIKKYVEAEIITKTGQRLKIGWHISILRNLDGRFIGLSLTGTSSLAVKDEEVVMNVSRKRSKSDEPKTSSRKDFLNNTTSLWSLSPEALPVPTKTMQV